MSQDAFPLFCLSRDGKEVLKGSQFECMDYIHNTHSCSFDWACKYEGYSLKPA